VGGLPDINEPLPAKLKWKHRKRYQALRNQIHNLEASIKGYRFEKPLVKSESCWIFSPGLHPLKAVF